MRVLLVLIALTAPAWAHKPSDAHLARELDGDRVTGRLDVALRDLDAAVGLDSNGDGDITWAELEAATPRVRAYLADRLAIASAQAASAEAASAEAASADAASVGQPASTSCPLELQEKVLLML